MLLATTTYKLQIIRCGGQLQDVRDFWKEAMKIALSKVDHHHRLIRYIIYSIQIELIVLVYSKFCAARI